MPGWRRKKSNVSNDINHRNASSFTAKPKKWFTFSYSGHYVRCLFWASSSWFVRIFNWVYKKSMSHSVKLDQQKISNQWRREKIGVHQPIYRWNLIEFFYPSITSSIEIDCKMMKSRKIVIHRSSGRFTFVELNWFFFVALGTNGIWLKLV